MLPRPFTSIIILGLWLIGTVLSLNAQMLKNPSFEGEPQQHEPPPPWEPCHRLSSPDTYPGPFNVSLGASDGATYMGMVSRGNQGPYANTTEDCQQKLKRPFVPGRKYKLKIDLARSINMGHSINFGTDWISYSKAVHLQIWLGRQSCQKDTLIWQSPAIKHSWKTYTININPNKVYPYLIFKVRYAEKPKYFGNVLIDNLRLKILEQHCKIYMPNAFTPNGDGLNDIFRPVTECQEAIFDRLFIYNRWGEEIYRSDQPTQGWAGKVRGKRAPEGTYAYRIIYRTVKNHKVIKKSKEGFVYLIR